MKGEGMDTQSSMQAMVDGLSAQWQRDRAQTQMTLGSMIQALEAMPGDASIEGIGHPHSYRGYYADLAFEPINAPTTATVLLALCRGAMGEVFTGYKGGDFVMGKLTPVWVANYGSCGKKIMALRPNGTLEVKSDD